MKYKIAELIVEFESKYDMLKSRAQKYKVEEKENTDLKIVVKEENIKKHLKRFEDATEESEEYVWVGNVFYRKLIEYNGCLLHASCVVIDNEAYLFSANSGTGKSTHTGLWLKYLADKNPYILNDDKPAIRVFDDGIYAYGTPFSGKHDISENKKVKIKGICFIERSNINSIREMTTREKIKAFFEQTDTYLNREKMLKFLDTLDIIIKNIPIYKLSCDMSEDAVKLSYETMRGENTDEN